MKPLDRVVIKGFKSIRELDLQLKSLNILIGANGAGKSNFISFFQLLNAIIEERLKNYVARSGGVDKFLYYGRRTTEQVEFELYLAQNGYSVSLAPTEDDKFYFAEEDIWFQGLGYSQPYLRELGSSHYETKLFEGSRSRNTMTMEDHIIRSIRSWKVYHFHDTSENAKVKGTGDIYDNQFFRPDASNLAAFLYRLQQQHPGHYRRIVSTINLAAPFFRDFNLRPDPLNQEKIRLEWLENGSDAIFNATYLSDGTLRFMSLTTLLQQPDLPSTILIDEPELGLHPYAINLLAGMLKSAAIQTQVIVSTQSVPLINQFTPEDIIVVDRLDQQSTFRRLTTEEISHWIEEYGLGELWEKNVIGGRPQR